MPLKHTTCYNVHRGYARFLWREANTVKPGQPELHTLVPPPTGHENERTSRLHLTCHFSARYVAWEGRMCLISEWINTFDILFQSVGSHDLYADANFIEAGNVHTGYAGFVWRATRAVPPGQAGLNT